MYRYLDIGSGKLNAEMRNKIPHHGIDIVDPDENFTAGDFVRYTEKICDEIRQRNALSLFVGGTGFYLDAFFKGLSGIPNIDNNVKEILQTEAAQNLELLYDELRAVDPVFANKIHPNDRQRIIRGLEVYRGTGYPITWYYQGMEGYESEDTLYVGLYDEREALYGRINQRVESMINEGFTEEVRRLRAMGYGPELKSMNSIGYAELNKHLDGLLSLEEAVEVIKTETRHYAKRQMTWFRKNKKINWFKPSEQKTIFNCIETWLLNKEYQ